MTQLESVEAEGTANLTGLPFVGFYWTLPILAVGFTSLPEDVDAAAAASRTIRYQRERIRRWVEGERGKLVGEYAFMELRPDRGSPYISGQLEKALGAAKAAGGQLVYVQFSDYHNAREHRFMMRLIYEAADSCVALPPDPEMIDGALFDPIQHFRGSRRTLPRAWSDEHRMKTSCAVAAAVAEHGLARGSAERIAETLNARGITTLNGRPWRGANVRAFLRTQAAKTKISPA